MIEILEFTLEIKVLILIFKLIHPNIGLYSFELLNIRMVGIKHEYDHIFEIGEGKIL